MAIIKEYENFFRAGTYDDLDLTVQTGALLEEGVVRVDEANDNFSVKSVSDNQIILNSGSAYLGGEYGYFVKYVAEFSTDGIEFNFSPPTTNDRTDLIVVQVDRPNTTISIEKVTNDTESTSPPTLNKDLMGTGFYQIPLYEVTIDTAGNVTYTDVRKFVKVQDSERFSGAVLSIDGTFTDLSDLLVPTEKAIGTYVTNITGNLVNLDTTNTSNLVASINSVKTELGTLEGTVSTNETNISTNTGNISTNTSNIGSMTSLATTDKTDLVNAVNELHSQFNSFTVDLVQSDWDVTDTASDAYIKNKPSYFMSVDLLHTFSLTSTTSDADDQIWSGAYSDITGGHYMELIVVLNDNDETDSSVSIPVNDFLNENWYEVRIGTNTNAYGRAQKDTTMNLSKGVIKTDGTNVYAKLPGSMTATTGTVKMTVYGLK